MQFRSTKWKVAAAAGVIAIAVLGFLFQRWRRPPFRFDQALQASFNSILDDYRKVIVLADGLDSLDAAARSRSIAAGRMVFYRKQNALAEISRRLAEEYRQAAASGFRGNTNGVRQLIGYLSGDTALRDADKLAFLDLAEELQSAVPQTAAQGNWLADPLRGLLDNLGSIQLAYREEVTRAFSQFGMRGPAATREKWEAYVRFLREIWNREKLLIELGDSIPQEPEESVRGMKEIFGNEFAPQSVALTFDDGPHPKYTEQVLALLRKYGVKAAFFELGVHLGTVSGSDQVKLSQAAAIASKVFQDGHVIANHSYSHRLLPKLPGQEQADEIDRTHLLLETISGRKPGLFRAPYGARNREILDRIDTKGLRSVMWTIDSMDWADPVPESIAMRVLSELSRKRRGIVLFHDIHKQSVLALSPVIEELQRQNYTFLSFENGQFVAGRKTPEADRAAELGAGSAVSQTKPSFYRESWAVVIGINDYAQWPKLRYAVNDANAVEETLIRKFGFKRENIRKLTNAEATRQRIMEALGDEFMSGGKIHREDRVFFFFAGHGATRKLDDGRQLGFIVPADADRSNYYSTAISMSAIREASDLIPAKHVYFIMDSCYGGLALTRGAGAFARDRTYLEEITRRSARQILTAGGADQQVADDGPQGHSVFTWALLLGLEGEADLDGNSVITASELGAYISPIVSRLARQTPAVGNLVGSEGGEFLFELQPEPLTAMTRQLDTQSLQLNQQLSALQQEIAARQTELLKLQQSIQAETARLSQVRRPERVVRSPRAYDLDRQGLQLYRAKQYELAEEKFRAAVALKPGDPVLLNNLGYIYYVMGRFGEARTYLEKTLAADPRRKEAHGNIAELYLKLDLRAEARKHYESYVALDPSSPKSEEFRAILRTLN